MHIVPMTKDAETCMQMCEQCHHVCVELLTYCVEQGNKYTEPEHIRILRDCAEICQTTANFMLRGSKMHAFIGQACAEICRRCAESCEKFSNDEKMRMCADMCRSCAQSCRSLAQSATTV